jgi:hypothetical protein
MRYVELEAGWDVVFDVGHSGGVRALAAARGRIVSGGDDGYLFVRTLEDGRSTVPPPHLADIRAVAVIAETGRALVATDDGLVGVDLETGAFGDLEGFSSALGAVVWTGDAAIVGADDGSVWRLPMDGSPRLVDELGASVEGMAIDAAAGLVVAVTVDGQVVGIDASAGRVRWRRQHAPGQAAHVAVAGGVVVIGGAGPEENHGRLASLAADGGAVVVQIETDWRVDALTSTSDDIAAAFADGSVVRYGRDLTDAGAVGKVAGTGVESLLVAGDDIWAGTGDGRVVRVHDGAELPSVSSGVFALTVRSDESLSVGTDGSQLVTWDVREGVIVRRVEIPGVLALSYARDDSDDLVLAFTDGRVERRTGDEWSTVAATGALGFRPRSLGWFGGRIAALGAGRTDVLDAESLEPSSLPDAVLEGVARVERTGFAFTTCGTIHGLELAVIAGEHLVVRRPGLLGIGPGAGRHVRIWTGAEFLSLDRPA